MYVHVGITGRADPVCGDAPHRAVTPAVSCTAAGGEDGISGGPE